MPLNDFKILLLVMLIRRKRRKITQQKRTKKKLWIRKFFANHEIFGEYHHLLSELHSGVREFYFRYNLHYDQIKSFWVHFQIHLRMNLKGFDHLVNLMKGKVTKDNNKV